MSTIHYLKSSVGYTRDNLGRRCMLHNTLCGDPKRLNKNENQTTTVIGLVTCRNCLILLKEIQEFKLKTIEDKLASGDIL